MQQPRRRGRQSRRRRAVDQAVLLVEHRRRRRRRPDLVQPERVRAQDPAGLEEVAQDTDHAGHVRGERFVRVVGTGHARQEGPAGPQAIVVLGHVVHRRAEERSVAGRRRDRGRRNRRGRRRRRRR